MIDENFLVDAIAEYIVSISGNLTNNRFRQPHVDDTERDFNFTNDGDMKMREPIQLQNFLFSVLPQSKKFVFIRELGTDWNFYGNAGEAQWVTDAMEADMDTRASDQNFVANTSFFKAGYPNWELHITNPASEIVKLNINVF